jgi:hypothetical protein
LLASSTVVEIQYLNSGGIGLSTFLSTVSWSEAWKVAARLGGNHGPSIELPSAHRRRLMMSDAETVGTAVVLELHRIGEMNSEALAVEKAKYLC